MIESNFSTSIEKWLLGYKDILALRTAPLDGPKIIIDDTAGKLAFLYEKIRNTVDYKEDYLLRKNAISRIIKRIATLGSKGSDIAPILIEELIRARYLFNNEISETAVTKAEHIINKYIIIYNTAIDNNYPPKELRSFFNWLVDISACEIEGLLAPAYQNKISIEAMWRVIKQSITLDIYTSLDNPTRDVQFYIGLLKSLLKADEATVNYYLLRYYYPNWNQLNLKEAQAIATDIKQKQALIKLEYGNHLNEKFTREFKRYAVSFWILQEIIEANPDNYINIFKNKNALHAKIKTVCKTKYDEIGGKVRRSIIRSIIYIFLTKIIFGIILELPYDYYVLKNIQLLPLGINTLFPPLLMATIGISIHIPKNDNTAAIIKNIDNMVYNETGEEHRIKIIRPKKGFVKYLLQFIYFVLYFVSFGLIIYGLNKLHFSPASMMIFLLFLTLVSFFSLRIRKTATEFIILKKPERFLTVLFGFLFVPILRVGRWISLHSSKINVFIFLLDFIIESPFKTFVRIFEDLIVFVKEKRDEMM